MKYFNIKKTYGLIFSTNIFYNFADEEVALKDILKELKPEDIELTRENNLYEKIAEGIVNCFFDKDDKLNTTGRNLESAMRKYLEEKINKLGITDESEKQKLVNDIKNGELKDLIQSDIIGFPSNIKKENYTHATEIYNDIYYIERKQDTERPLVVWFHGNGKSCSYLIDKDTDNDLKNVISFEYPNYIDNTFGTFEKLQEYTDALATFLKGYISENKFKKIILLSHSFGCNVSTLVYSKLKNEFGDKIKSILVFPYHDGIDATSNIMLKFFKDLLENFLGKYGVKRKDINENILIYNVVFCLYKRIFETKQEKKNNYTPYLHILTSLIDNSYILEKCYDSSIKEKFLNESLLIDYDRSHTGWECDGDINFFNETKKIKDFLLDFDSFKIDTKDIKKDIKFIVFTSHIDDVVGNGGFLIFQHFFNMLQQKVQNTENNLYTKNYEKLKKEYENIGYNLNKDEIDLIKKNYSSNLSHLTYAHDKNIEYNGMCASCINLKNYNNSQQKKTNLEKLIEDDKVKT